jgi:hypothetical protein
MTKEFSMKLLGNGLLHLALLALLVACGKDNKSGTNSYANPYYGNAYGTINSPYHYGNVSVNQIIQQNPCVTGGVPTQARVQVQMPVNMGTIVPTNDIYVGVTSSGDVGLIVGKGSVQALFVAYICQRGVTYQNATPQLMAPISIGPYTKCPIKPITAASIYIPGGVAPLNFRWLEGGSSLGQKFTFCAY